MVIGLHVVKFDEYSVINLKTIIKHIVSLNYVCLYALANTGIVCEYVYVRFVLLPLDFFTCLTTGKFLPSLMVLLLVGVVVVFVL